MNTRLNRRVALGLTALVIAYALATAPSAVAQDVPLAIKGYDPVAYFTDGRPTPGRPDIEYQWDEHPIASRVWSIASFSRPNPCATRRNSETSAPWRWPWAGSSWPIQRTG